MAIIKRRRDDDSFVGNEEVIFPEISILHMYPREMNIYGDYGNITALKKRTHWRGLGAKVFQLHIGGKITDETGNEVADKTISDFDIYFMGGGQDADQADVYQDLLKYKSQIQNLVNDDKVFLLICGGYQLFGKHFLTVGGKNIEGLGILDVDTVGGKTRCIGNIVVDSSLPELKDVKLVGFENHSGRTRHLSHDVKVFGKVLFGTGNSESGGEEGGVFKNVFGCYLHGSFLPKNPEFADMLLQKAFDKKYSDNKIKLIELDDYAERAAREKIIEKVLG